VARVVLALVIVALAALPAAAAGDAPEPLLAIVSEGTLGDLVQLDPATLAPVPGVPRLRLGLQDIPWARSPDGSLLAIGSGRSTNLAFVDVRSMQRVGDLDVAFATALAWPRQDRLVLLEREALQYRLAIVDPHAPRVLTRRALGTSDVASAAVTRDGLAVLMMPRLRIGTATLVVLDADGRARRVSLPRIAAGAVRKASGERRRTWYRHPALAVDADGGRAYVSAGLLVAVVDLETLDVRYRQARQVRARLARPEDGGNHLSTGTQRQALWLGDGLIALSGWNARVVPGSSFAQGDEPAGLSVLDTRDWTVRRVLPEGRWFHATGELLLTHAPPSRRPGTALAGFTHEGAARFRVEVDQVYFGVQSAGPYAYLGLGQQYKQHDAMVVDTRTGEIVGTPRAPGWVLLLSPSQPQFCWCYTGTTVG